MIISRPVLFKEIQPMDYGLQLMSEKIVNTKYGARLLRVFDPTEDFWQAWRERKDALKRHVL